jgi:hypothetical protein
MGTEARYYLRVDYNEMSAKVTTLVTALKAKVSARAEQYYHQSAEIIHPLKHKLEILVQPCRMDYPELRKMHTQIDRGFSLLLENEQKRRWEEQELVKFVEESLLEFLKSIGRETPKVPEKYFEDEWLVSDDEDDNSSEHVPGAGN